MKIETLKQKISPHLSLLRCPICGSSFLLKEISLVCENGHCYDLSTHGYINLAPQHNQAADKYTTELFSARQRVMQGVFYEKLRKELVRLLKEAFQERSFVTVDVGCGEGTHTQFIARAFQNGSFFGTDLSRSALLYASKGITIPNWLCCDLTNLPFQDHSVDALLDILTPADYKEFRRVLKPQGRMIKVIPQKNYLCEIRQMLSDRLKNGIEYSSRPVSEYLEKHVKILKRVDLCDCYRLTEEESRDFLRMTPMTFSIQKCDLNEIHLNSLTIALSVLECEFEDI